MCIRDSIYVEKVYILITGASGYIPLNEAGDRAYADYELWEIVEKDGKYEWVATGLYSFATDSLTWS